MWTKSICLVPLPPKIVIIMLKLTFVRKIKNKKAKLLGSVFFVCFSFVNLDPTQDKVKLVKKFDEWKIGKDTIHNRMPYLGQSHSLLTTNEFTNYYGTGTIITDNDKLKPAHWIYPDMYEPGVIWYWMNEDDCDTSRTPGICVGMPAKKVDAFSRFLFDSFSLL